MTCQAQYERGGSMRCDRCGMIWDYNDPEPPRCKTEEELRAAEHQRGRKALDDLYKLLDDCTCDKTELDNDCVTCDHGNSYFKEHSR